MQFFVRYFINILFSFLPVFKFYAMKRKWLKWAGVAVKDGAQVNGHTIFYGRGALGIGENTWIGPGCRFYTHEDARIIIGDECDVAPEVSFITGSHDISGPKRRAGAGIARNIIVQDGCWIGARVTILGGVTIGKGSVVAAGALVNSDLPKNCVAAGVPARVIKILVDENGSMK